MSPSTQITTTKIYIYFLISFAISSVTIRIMRQRTQKSLSYKTFIILFGAILGLLFLKDPL